MDIDWIALGLALVIATGVGLIVGVAVDSLQAWWWVRHPELSPEDREIDELVERWIAGELEPERR